MGIETGLSILKEHHDKGLVTKEHVDGGISEDSQRNRDRASGRMRVRVLHLGVAFRSLWVLCKIKGYTKDTELAFLLLD